MIKRIRNRWVKLLRSGKFKQGQRYLRDFDDSYCCLGVLLSAVDSKSWKSVKIKTEYAFQELKEWKHPGRADLDFLTKAFLKKVGMTDEQQRHLAVMNDTGKSFKRIATYIEKNL
jgi:hypothetical protein